MVPSGKPASGRSQYNINRYRDPLTSFLEADPIGLAGGSPSLYAPLNENPITNVDPTGENAAAIPLPRPIPLPGWAGPAAGVAASGYLGWQLGSTIYDRNAERIGDLVDKVADMCKEDDSFCYKRWEQEDARCNAWRRLGGRVVAACKTRAADRRNLCVRNGGKPDPSEPPEYSPFRDYPR